jgi:hypothetical protein
MLFCFPRPASGAELVTTPLAVVILVDQWQSVQIRAVVFTASKRTDYHRSYGVVFPRQLVPPVFATISESCAALRRIESMLNLACIRANEVEHAFTDTRPDV